MGSLMGRFAGSRLAERLEQRRRKQRRITVRVGVDPQSKNRRKTAAQDQKFHRAVADAIEKRGRHNPFRVPVAIRMHFRVGINTPAPLIDKLPKHYFDLLQVPRDRGVEHSPRLLLQNDRLVKALMCTYDFADYPGSRPEVFFEISTLKDFIHELILYAKIVNGHVERRPKDIRRLFARARVEDEDSGDALDTYNWNLKQREELSGRYRQFSDIMLPTLQEAAQEEVLRRREPGPIEFSSIYQGLVKRRSIPTRHLFDVVARMLRQVFDSGIATIDLGAPAARSGDSEQFRKKVRSALTAMQQDKALFDPFLTTVGITILYVPPLSEERVDLDNLAMHIVPYVRLELKPPATFLHAIEHFKPMAISGNLGEQLRRHHRVEKNQVTRYQIFEIPRLEDDPPAGNVRLLLHGRNEFCDPWALCREAVDLWAGVPLETEY
jgi:hypothetical protein